VRDYNAEDEDADADEAPDADADADADEEVDGYALKGNSECRMHRNPGGKGLTLTLTSEPDGADEAAGSEVEAVDSRIPFVYASPLLFLARKLRLETFLSGISFSRRLSVDL